METKGDEKMSVAYLISIVGITGSGKSTISKFLKEMIPDSEIIDGDVRKHDAFAEQRELLGDEWYNPDGTINTKKLALFPEKYHQWSHVTDPRVSQMIDGDIEQITAKGKKVIILEWYALTRLKFWNQADLRILMNANKADRHKRLSARHGNRFPESFYDTRDERLKADYTQLSVAPDFTFVNEAGFEEIRSYASQVAQYVERELIVRLDKSIRGDISLIQQTNDGIIKCGNPFDTPNDFTTLKK